MPFFGANVIKKFFARQKILSFKKTKIISKNEEKNRYFLANFGKNYINYEKNGSKSTKLFENSGPKVP